MRKTDLERYIYPAAALLFAANIALYFIGIPELRLVTALGILFLLPGVFVTRLLYPSLPLASLEALMVSMLSSIALNTLTMFALNVAARVPFSDVTVLAVTMGLSAAFGMLAFLREPRRQHHVPIEGMPLLREEHHKHKK